MGIDIMTVTPLLNPTAPAKVADHIRWGQLQGSSLALAIAQYYQQHKQALVIITADTPSALKLTAELEALAKHQFTLDELHYFPDWETLPYDNFSPHQDIIWTALASKASTISSA